MNTPVWFPRGFVPTAGRVPCIVCCTSANENWQERSDALDRKTRQWYFCTDQPTGFWDRLIRYPNLATLRASWQAIQLVKRNRAGLLVTSHPTITFWCAVFATLQNVRVDHVALSFYLPKLPHNIAGVLAQLAYSTVNKFIVHSRAERQIYSEYFGILPSRFEMQHWGGELPPVHPSKPLESGEYICAISEQPQDYPTLLAAIATLPEIPLVLVVPCRQAISAKIPPNVTIRRGLSAANRMNILHYSRFMVLPARNSQIPCDHQVMVAAMQLGKAFVVSNLASVNDYAFHHSNAVMYEPSNPESLAQAIHDLWNNLIKCEILGTNGKEFAETFCSQTATQEHFQRLLFRRGL
ncbi:MAG: hypothetical protein NW224_28980 [Leptolyngbyaceae cyanobacterium bins.302]|nr:hypothetical protein [Leptolyngbyaceae cyanobacterium bins.302]